MDKLLKPAKAALSAEQLSAWHQQIRLRFKEGLLIALAALCIFLWMILLTFDATDPGFSQVAGSRATYQNAGGPLGAWLADVLLASVGYFAWLLPLILMLKVVLVFRLRYQPIVWRPSLLLARVLGLVLLITSGAGLSAMHFAAPDIGLKNFNILGGLLASPLQELLNLEGATLVLLAALLFGFTLFTNLSWFRLMEMLGEGAMAVIGWLGRLFSNKGSELASEPEHEPRRARGAYSAKAEPQVAEQVAKPSTQPRQLEPVLQPEPSPVARPPQQAQRSEPQITPLVASPQPSQQLAQEKQAPQFIEDALVDTLPPMSLLDRPQQKKASYSPESLRAMSHLLELKLKEFGVEVEVESVHPGPVVTRFEIELAPGVKVSRITNLAKDLARSMAMISVRVVEVIPGKTTVGIEVPNEDRQIVRLAEVLGNGEFDEAKSVVTLGLGHDIGGQPVLADLARMPHLLVAGTTGSGKSVGVNAMILSMLFKSPPEDVRLIMIDPKMLELSIYEGIPHLLCPVVTDMKEAANALRWCVAEMERRYKLLSKVGVRNLAGYNRKVKEAQQAGEPLLDPLFVRESPDDLVPELEKLPTIVVVVDEFADMMMIVGKKVEELIARIAQKARAAGIHLILATQRPSVDVITGLIKANIPTRMAFQVSSKIDSRTILDQGGAEQLLGHGDMLYLPPGTSLPIRVHGAFVSDDEVHRVVDAWKARGAPDYIEAILDGIEEEGAGFNGEVSGGSEEDPLFDQAVHFVTETRRVSISSVQRKLKVGYNRAANIVEAMEAAGVISSAGHNGSREVLAPAPVRD